MRKPRRLLDSSQACLKAEAPQNDSAPTRRQFLAVSGFALLGAGAPEQPGSEADPIIDIHQHLNYSGRSDAALLAHQITMGATTTILLPSGRPLTRASTHDGKSNGLDAQALGNEACWQFARTHRAAYRFAANEVPDIPEARSEIEQYLRRGAVMIAEQKFGVECDSPEMQRIYATRPGAQRPGADALAVRDVQQGLRAIPPHAGEVLAACASSATRRPGGRTSTRTTPTRQVLYPKGPVTAGGLTDRYLADYPNMFGDLSAGSGLNALTRDEDFTRGFLERHQDKLLFGSDCSDPDGSGAKCQGSQTIAVIRRLAASRTIERKLLHGNAQKLLRL